MARSRKLNRPVRAALATWVRPACLLLIYLGSTAQPLFHGDWRAAATFALAGLGFVVTMLVKHVTPQHRHTPEDRNRLDVLTLQALAAFLMGWTVDAIWYGMVVGAPLAVTLAAVVTATMAAEAVAIYVRSGTGVLAA